MTVAAVAVAAAAAAVAVATDPAAAKVKTVDYITAMKERTASTEL